MKKTCLKGHVFYKTSDCPVCPICEQQRKSESDFLSVLGAPAKRALENNGITSLDKLSQFTEAQLLKLHGFGPSSLPKLIAELNKSGLEFRK